MSSPLESPLFRYGVGIGGAMILVVVGTFFLEPPVRYLVYAMAVLDAVVTPWVLERAMEQERDETTA